MQFPPERPDSQTLVIERVFDCTPEEMWAAWTDPKQLAKWISPFPGLDAEVHQLDARKGGKLRFTMISPDGSRYPEETSTFEVFDPPRDLVQYKANEGRSDAFDGYPMRMKAHFEALGKDRTRLILTQTGLPPTIPLDMARTGYSACLDKLADHLGKERPRALTMGEKSGRASKPREG